MLRDDKKPELSSPSIQTLLIDNYDSYTYNLYQHLSVINNCTPIVIHNDRFKSWKDVTAAYPQIDNVVISPGPGRPNIANDFGICQECIEQCNMPLLGVCLGHQGLAYTFGAQIIAAPEIMHGRSSTVTFANNTKLFEGLPSTTEVVRYHSLIIDAFSLPSCFDVNCWTTDSSSIIMGIQHKTLPFYGVQFHPESIGTKHGYKILSNFKGMTIDYYLKSNRSLKAPLSALPTPSCIPSASTTLTNGILEVNRATICFETPFSETLPLPLTTEEIFEAIFADDPIAFWLDSNTQEATNEQRDTYSYLGGAMGPLSEALECVEAGAFYKLYPSYLSEAKEVSDIFNSPATMSYCREKVQMDILEYMRHLVPQPKDEGAEGISGVQSVCGLELQHRKWKTIVRIGHTDTAVAPLNASSSASQGTLFGFSLSTTSSACASPSPSSFVSESDNGFEQSLGSNMGKVMWLSEDLCSTEEVESGPFIGGYVGFFGYEMSTSTRQYLLQSSQPKGVSTREAVEVSVANSSNKRKHEASRLMDKSVSLKALWIWADRFVVVNHTRQQLHILWLCPSVQSVKLHDRVNAAKQSDMRHTSVLQRFYSNQITLEDAKEIQLLQEQWVNKVLGSLSKVITSKKMGCAPANQLELSKMDNRFLCRQSTDLPRVTPHGDGSVKLCFYSNQSRIQYQNNILDIQRQLQQGESYEVCLTNCLKAHIEALAVDPLKFYLILRRKNPTSYSAFIRYDPYCHFARCKNAYTALSEPNSCLPTKFNRENIAHIAIAICCSSPERLLRIDREGRMESKPIKGTIRRGKTHEEDLQLAEDLRTSTKERCENLMIVDLVRNDLGRVCYPGSVYVPSLMNIESFATVHQLVSTIRGKLLGSKFNAIDALAALFPPGSMTGAPKERSMDIIKRIEVEDRGPYSGSLGYISLNGCTDLNVIIRTAVITPKEIRVGAGGAIVALSDAEQEYQEMRLKANAVISSFRTYVEAHHNGIVIERIETPEA